MIFMYAIPIVGHILRCIDENRPQELLMLLMNMLMIAALAVMAWGYPALIVIALGLTCIVAISVLLLTLDPA